MKKERGFSEFVGEVPSDGNVPQNPPFSDVSERALEVALNIGNKFVSPPRLPWESGFLRDVLSSGSTSALPWLNPLVIPKDLPSSGPSRLTVTPTVNEKRSIAKARMYQSVSASIDEERQSALAKWLNLVMMYPEESRLGILILAETMTEAEQKGIPRLMEHWMARKSTSTLTQRAGSIAMYVKYCKTYADEFPIIPIDESVVYKYVVWLRETGKPPTRAHTFVSSLSFVGELLGWKGASDAASSQRVLGAAHLCFLRKRMLRQAPPLDIVAIIVLELRSLFVKDDFVRGCAGFCLCALYGRLRVSDCNRLSHGKIIGQFFEGCLCRVKTARTLEKQTRFLPVILPTRGLLGFPWFEQFLETRTCLGLEAIPATEDSDREERFILFPSQKSWLDFQVERMGAAEMTERLCECLAKVLPKDCFQHYTSHSLKCTLLTYTNIFGLSLEQNELLGYHVVKGHSSALNYSRDALASPIRAMMTMLEGIRMGTFRPLAERSSHFVDRSAAVPAMEQFAVSVESEWETVAECIACFNSEDDDEAFSDFMSKLQYVRDHACGSIDKSCEAGQSANVQDISSDEESEVESSDSGSTSMEEALAFADGDLGEERWGNINVHADMSRVFRHVRTKMLHFARTDDMHKTCCGRVVGDTFTIFKKDPENAWPKCRVCFGK